MFQLSWTFLNKELHSVVTTAGFSCFELDKSSSNFPSSAPLRMGFKVADATEAMAAARAKGAKVGYGGMSGTGWRKLKKAL